MSALVTTADTAAPVRPKRSAKGLLLQYLLFKTLGPTKYHFGHLHDSERWQIFAKALRSVDNDKKQHKKFFKDPNVKGFRVEFNAKLAQDGGYKE